MKGAGRYGASSVTMRALCICLALMACVEAWTTPEMRAEVVVLARLGRQVQRGAPGGFIHWIGESEYTVVRVEEGQLAVPRVVVELFCPADG